MNKKKSPSSAPPISSADPLHVALRPASFDEVVGQEPVVKSLRALLDGKDAPHAYLFTGPSGVGKTTLARILAHELGVSDQGIVEIDAATHSGIDAMREVIKMARYQSLGESPRKLFIVDECHALSKATWQSLLLAIEEPPAHAYWALCTTEADKVPKTILTRCHAYELRSLPKALLEDYLLLVNADQRLGCDDEVVAYVAGRAEGSVRQALVYLSAARGCSSREEAHALLAGFEENPELIELVRRIVSGKGDTRWETVTGTLSKLDEAPESIRVVVVNYIAAALMRERNEKKVLRYLTVLDAFREPYRAAERHAPLLLSIGRVLYSEE